jgi:hypothetical protein
MLRCRRWHDARMLATAEIACCLLGVIEIRRKSVHHGVARQTHPVACIALRA